MLDKKVYCVRIVKINLEVSANFRSWGCRSVSHAGKWRRWEVSSNKNVEVNSKTNSEMEKWDYWELSRFVSSKRIARRIAR